MDKRNSAEAAESQLGQWVCESYGAPDGTSEVNRIAGFYRLEAITAFRPRENRAAEDEAAPSPVNLAA